MSVGLACGFEDTQREMSGYFSFNNAERMGLACRGRGSLTTEDYEHGFSSL